MKKFAKAFVALMMMFTLVACTSKSRETGIYTAGTYTGAAEGRNGDVRVEVVVTESKIESVTVTEHQETAGIADGAITGTPEAIVEAQGTDVDTVAGATITSDAIIAAVNKALAEARGEEISNAAERDMEADVIVIGAGGAGLAAAATAVAEGAEVIVLEVNSYVGGAALSAAGIILKLDEAEYVANERNDVDLEKYLKYTPEDFPGEWRNDYETLLTQIEEYKNNGLEIGAFGSIERLMVDHYLTGNGTDLDGKVVTLDYDLIRASIEENMTIYNWLTDAGMTSKMNAEYKAIPMNRGVELVETLAKLAEGADIQFGIRGQELIVTDGKVTGVKAVDKDGNEIVYTAKNGVVVATGGYASNTEMVAQYQRLGTGLNENTPSNDPESIQGDGILMAQQLGAKVIDLEFITTRIMGYQHGCTTDDAGTVFSAAQLAVNKDAVRFVDDSNKSVIQNVDGNNQEDGVFYMVGDSKMIEAINAKTEGLADALVERGIAFKGETVEEAATLAGLDSAVLAETVANFNLYVDAENDPEFGRTKYNGKVEEGCYIVKLQMAYHLTFGGLVVDENMHVLDTDGNAINGLYAAGDVLSGFEGVVHQGGNCLTVVIYAGREAGINAANNK